MSEPQLLFDTMEAAQTCIRADNNKLSMLFCPLIHDMCRRDCQCFQLAQVEETNDGFRVYTGFCNNAMFSGGDRCNHVC